MKLIRPGILAAVASIATVTAAAPALASPAVPAAGTITISDIFSPNDNAGLLTMTVSAPANVTSITAHIMSGTTDVLDVSDFVQTAGTAPVTTWAVSSPITENQLALGVYDVTVDVTDSAGDSATISGAGSFYFTVRPTVTLAQNPSVFTYLHQTAQLSGTVTGLWPNGVTQPLSGFPVYVTDQGGTLPTTPTLVGTTASDGSYSGSVTPDFVAETGYPDWYYTYINATSTVSATISPFGQLNTASDPISVKASVSPAQIKYGQVATLSGTVVFHEGTTSGPVAGDTIMLSDQYGIHQATGTTDALGKFAIKLPPTASTPWFVQAQSPRGANSIWFGNAGTKTSIKVALPVSFVSFKARLTGTGYVVAGACLHTDVTDTSIGGPMTNVVFQYSASQHGPWSKLGMVHTVYRSSTSWCAKPHDASASVRLPGHLINAYYRAVLRATPNYQPAVSGIVHAWLYRSKITNVAVSPSTVSPGGTATISGRLWRQGKSGWSPYGSRRVIIIYRLRGGKTWYRLHGCGTNSGGWFHLKFIDGASADLRAIYLGDSTHLWSASTIVSITTAASKPGSPSPGSLTPIPMPVWLRAVTGGQAQAGRPPALRLAG